ncbi:MAG: hypothetical protein HN590_08225, partial [Calditrichaeota bacterium]|nr:hypothetical protein [Calditrichota bacterium]
PENRDQIVEIILNVTGFPIADIEWDEEFGFDNEVDFNLAYEPLYNRGEYPVQITLANIGTDDLHIQEIVSDNENFLTDWDAENQDIVQGDEEITFNFILSTNEIDDLRGIFTLTFDEEDDVAPIEIPVVGITVGTPILVIDTDEIVEDLLSNMKL